MKKKPQIRDVNSDLKENETKRLALQGLLNHPGWSVLEEAFSQNIDYLSEQILEKIDAETGNPLSEIQADELRFKRQYLKELLGKPSEMIEVLTERVQGNRDMEDPLDPYQQYMPKKGRKR
jgi:hypothetical protein